MAKTPTRFSALVLVSIALLGCATQQSPPVALNPIDNGIPPAPEGVYDISKVTVPPRPVFQARPHYPHELRLAVVSGEAVIVFTVTPEGNVVDATIAKATDVRFGDAAQKAVSK